MKVALVGATGFVGSHILQELLNRKHQVTAIVRNPNKLTVQNPLLTIVRGDVLQEAEVAALVKNNDVVVSAYNAGWSNPNIYNEFIAGSKAIQAGVKKSGVKRLLVIGGAGSLYVAPGVQIIDTPQFPEEFKPGASAARDYLKILQDEKELDWTCFSPAIEMNAGNAGVRTGTYRTNTDSPVFDETGRSRLSVEDLAVAIVDELENPKFSRKRFTAAY
jgi:uncharacterized protein